MSFSITVHINWQFSQSVVVGGQYIAEFIKFHSERWLKFPLPLRRTSARCAACTSVQCATWRRGMIAGKYLVTIDCSSLEQVGLYNEINVLSSLPIMAGSEVFRYRAVLMRARFDENKCKDIAEGMRLLAIGQQELFETKHGQPRTCKVFANVLRTMPILSMIFYSRE